MTHEAASSGAIQPSDINDALELFGEDIDNGEKVLVVSPSLATALRNAKGWLPASEIAADRMVKGAIGEAFGCQVIISNKLKKADGTDTEKAALIGHASYEFTKKAYQSSDLDELLEVMDSIK
jgi:N4-gp56 family major capsid protein